MTPTRTKGDRRVSLPHRANSSQSAHGTPLSALSQYPHVGPMTTPEEWDQIEQQYWADARKAAELEDVSMGEKYQQKTAPIKTELTPLLERRARLSEELEAVKTVCDDMEDELTQIDMQYFEAKEIIEHRRDDQRQRASEFFAMYKAMARRQAAGLASEGEKWRLHAAAAGVVSNVSFVASPTSDDTAMNEPGDAARDVDRTSRNGSSRQSSLSSPSSDSGEPTGVQVYGADGAFIDNVKKINLNNRHVRNILQIRPRRDVVVREGRKFNKETMASIYEPSDGKGAKWLSCMIQATGEEQDTPCEACRNKSGTWAGCVIVGGSDFPRCANCEWNRQGCVGSSYYQERMKDVDLQQDAQSQSVGFNEGSAPTSREGSHIQGFTPVNGAALRHDSATSTPMRVSLPSGKTTSGKTTNGKNTSGRNPLPSMAPPIMPDDSFQGFAADEQADPGPEIANGSLHLEDDGEVFTEPAIMRGVPVARISPDHPYWDKNWELVETSVRAKLAEWETKLQQCLDTLPKKRFLAQRQVNRGKTTLEFLKNGPIHPYQLVGKKFISKALISYDTVFRLAQVIDELPKFGVDVDPVAWLRERMHELYSEQGEAFSLSRTVHDLYRDPKLQFLRNRAGFGNIGRPCGVKKGMTSKYPGGIRPKDPRLPPPPRAKRGGAALTNGTAKRPRNTPSPQIKDESNSPREARQAGGLEADEGYSSTDSSGENLSEFDWRLQHLKTDTSQPGENQRQYWHLVTTDAQQPYFEHQIMVGEQKDAVWKVYPEPHNFHLYVSEIERIRVSSPDFPKIIVHTRQVEGIQHRGRIMVEFKRPRTMKRFLDFVHQNYRVSIENSDQRAIEEQWSSCDVPTFAIPPPAEQ